MSAKIYELYYWSGLQGRGEFVRLALEDAGAPYRDMAREKGDGIISELAADPATLTPSFAPPFLRDGEIVIGQTSAILAYLGPALGLVSQDAAQRAWTNQIQLTIADCVAEAHNTHHPLSAAAYYEDQKPEARRNAAAFRNQRLPKFFNWFETVLVRNPQGPTHLAGKAISYADLSVFQLVEALSYAFPNRMAQLRPAIPRILDLCARVRSRPGIAAYLASPRRIAFNTTGIFRHYPELDEPE